MPLLSLKGTRDLAVGCGGKHIPRSSLRSSPCLENRPRMGLELSLLRVGLKGYKLRSEGSDRSERFFKPTSFKLAESVSTSVKNVVVARGL